MKKDDAQPAQPDLFAAPAPEVSGHQVNQFIHLLRGRPWTTAEIVKCRYGWNDRLTRAVANASEGQIISGQRGYKLTLEATLEEITHAASRLRAQARSMEIRAMQIEKVRHSA